MRRRDFLTVLGSAAAWPLAARAQQSGAMRRIGLLTSLLENDLQGQRVTEGITKGLLQLGWVPGRNAQIEYRWAGDDPVLSKTYAAELVAWKADVVVVTGGIVLAAIAQLTRSIPIVFTNINDPLGSGYVASLARPGGNITGFAVGEFSMYEKYVGLLKQVAPGINRVGVLLNPDQTAQMGMLRAIEAIAPSIGVNIVAAGVHNAVDIEGAIESLTQAPDAGLVVLANPITTIHRDLIMSLAARRRLPAVYAYSYFTAEGGLMSYSADRADIPQRAAAYVDRILKGEKPGDLPVQNPTRYELVINLKTAKSLGLTIPAILQATADEVIE
jgi:putative ABC transport system substrate-binding protein